MNSYLLISTIALGCLSFVGCGEKEECVANLVENCPVTYDINYVCGCDSVTYVNPSEAECYEIDTYTEGECEE